MVKYEVSKSSERAGSPQGQKCGSLAAITLRSTAQRLLALNSCGEIKLTLNKHRCPRDPPISVATFCEHLRAGRTLLDSSIDAKCLSTHGDEWLKASLESKFRRIHWTKAATPSPTSKLQSQIRSFASKPTTPIPSIICRIASSPKCHNL